MNDCFKGYLPSYFVGFTTLTEYHKEAEKVQPPPAVTVQRTITYTVPLNIVPGKVYTSKPQAENYSYTRTEKTNVSSTLNSRLVVENSKNIQSTPRAASGTERKLMNMPKETLYAPTSTEENPHTFSMSKAQPNIPPVQTGYQSSSGNLSAVIDSVKAKAQTCLEDIPNNRGNSLSNAVKHEEIPKIVGFQTASGTKVEISETAKQRASSLMTTIQNEHRVTSATAVQTSRDSALTIPNSISASISGAVKRKATDQEIRSPSKEYDVPNFVGFTSAAGKKIKISEGARNKAKNLLTEIENEPLSSNYEVPVSVGFSSASGKKIDISEEAKQKANRLLVEVQNERKMESNDIPQNVGFTSASGKKINVSEEATRNANKLLAEIDADKTTDTGGDGDFVGFQSASGRVINISAEAQTKAREVMASVGIEATPRATSPIRRVNKPMEKDYSNVPKGFRPFKAPKMAPSVKKEMLQAKHVLNEQVAEQSREQSKHSESNGSLRSEGMGRKSSSDSNQLSGLDGFTFTQIAEVTNSTAAFLETDDDVAWTQMPSKSNQETACIVPDENIPTADSGQALNLGTASGENRMHISESAEANESGFKDRPVENGLQQLSPPGSDMKPSPMPGFNTASGKPIQMTEESLRKAQTLIATINDGDGGNNSRAASPICRGFKTAAGQEIHVSDSAMQKAHDLMVGVEIDVPESAGTESEMRIKDEDAPENFDGVENESVWEDLELNDSLIKLTDETTTSRSNTPVHENIGEINDVVEHVTAEYHETIGMEMEPEKVTENDEKLDEKCLENSFDDCSVHSQEFVTASGYAIPVLDESMEKAKELFSDIHEDPEEDQGKAVDLTPDHLKENGKQYENPEPRTTIDCKENLDGNPVASKFLGFQTASGNKVEISADVLREVKQKYQGDEYASPMSDDCRVPNSQEKDAKKAGSVGNIGNLQNEGQCFGFQTASGRKVDIREESLVKAKERFDFPDKIPGQVTGSQTASGNQIDVDGNSQAKVQERFEAEERSPRRATFIGFQTASGSTVRVSDTSLQRARSLLGENIAPTSEHGASGYAKPFIGFSTASGSKVEISESALKRVRRLFDGPVENQMVPNSSGTLNDAMKYGEKDHDSPAKVPVIGFQTASGNEVKIPEEALLKVKDNFDNHITETGHCDKQALPFMGFQTASGGKVNISEDSLKRAKSLLGSSCTETETSLESKSSFGFQTASGNKVTVSESSLKKVKSFFDSPNVSEENKLENSAACGFTGFQTAGGNKVNISEGALKKVKGLFENESAIKEDTKANESFIGFQTASGAKVSVSENSLKQAQSLLGSESERKHHSDGKESGGFIGFQTASGGKVEISDAALQQAKGILGKDENMPQDRMESFGFQTASGTKVSISDVALKQAGVVLCKPDEINDAMKAEVTRKPGHSPRNSAKRLNFTGFETAAGSKVNVSDLALQEIQGARTAGGGFGFQTAAGSKVEVSTSALQYVKNAPADAFDGHLSSPKTSEDVGSGIESWNKSGEGDAGRDVPNNNIAHYGVTAETCAVSAQVMLWFDKIG